MSENVGGRREFGEGPLSHAAVVIYTLAVIEVLILVCTAPSLVLLVLLGHDASNAPLAAASALPIGPAISAAVYALRHRRADLTDLRPAAAYWRGYRLNLASSLKIWAVWLAWMTIVSVNLANLDAAGVPAWWAVLLVIVALAATLWEANALVITSLFRFRTRDVARLAAYFLARTPGATVANACLLIVAAAVTVYFSEAVLALLGSVFALALVRNSRHMIAEVTGDFIR